jgi:hypothetical protein
MFEDSNSIYRKLTDTELAVAEKHKIKFYKYSGLDLPFSPNWKKIAVNLSGGADSACLTYLLCKIIDRHQFNCKIDIITHVRCWTTRPWQQPISVKVYEKLKKMYPNIIGDRHENFITPELEHGVSGYIYKDPAFNEDHSGDQLQVSGFNLYSAHKFNLDAIFNATSANPPGTDFPKKMKDREKSAKDGVLRDLVMYFDERFLFHPFRFVDKSWIIAQYYKHKITDLLETTRSCEGDVTHPVIKDIVPDFKSYHPDIDVPECGTCFWCLERNWALSKLNDTLEKIKDV